jgi:predicted PurR-regulated permease PerM
MSQSEAFRAALPERRRRLAGDALFVVGVVLATAAVLAMAWATRAIIIWVLAAGFLAFSIDPLAQMLRSRARVGEGAAIALAMAVIGLVLFVIGTSARPSARSRWSASRSSRTGGRA